MHQMAAMKMMMMIKKNSLSPRMSSSSLTPPTSSSSSSSSSTASPSSLPVRAIPGSYGLPLIGSIPDRLDYYWFQGPETFFRKKMDKYKSSVFRTNIPPSFPFFGNVNPNMIAVLDCKSFAHLFDMDVVEKKDVLIGDFMPSVSFTGNMRVGIYRDTSEPQHNQVKNFSIDILKRSSRVWVSELLSNVDIMWATVEKDVSAGGKAMLIPPLQRFLFRFLTKVLMGADPKNSPEIDENGPLMLTKWLAIQIIPTQKVGILQPLEELLLHSFAYPFALVSGDYNKLYEFVKKEGKEVVERGISEFGLTQEETIHNLLFILGFNAFGGFSVFLPSLFGKLGEDKTGLQDKLREEVRQKSTSASSLSFDSVKEMELVKSFVYEVLRFSPPVPAQYARARKDFVLSSHDSAYQIKKGELLCGYQMLVMRDPNVFDNPESFDPYRFTKEKGGEELLSYLYWSNGPQTGTPSSSNKQCSAKDSVVLTTCLLIADLFWRYDSIKVDGGSITAVQKPAK